MTSAATIRIQQTDFDIAHEMAAAELGADRELQERLLGLRSGGGDDEAIDAPSPAADDQAPTQVLTVRRAYGDGAPSMADLAPGTVRGFTRWNTGSTTAPTADIVRFAPSAATRVPATAPVASTPAVYDFPVAATSVLGLSNWAITP